MNGSRAGLLPDPDPLSFSISSDGCVQDLPEPQGSTGPSAVTALDFGNGIIGIQGDPGRQLDPRHLRLRLLIWWLARHKCMGIIASWHPDVWLSIRHFRVPDRRRGCQVAKASAGGASRRVERSKARGRERARRKCLPSGAAGPGSASGGDVAPPGATWPRLRWPMHRGQRSQRRFQAGRLVKPASEWERPQRSAGPAAAEPERRAYLLEILLLTK
jgi:hypothetical protein